MRLIADLQYIYHFSSLKEWLSLPAYILKLFAERATILQANKNLNDRLVAAMGAGLVEKQEQERIISHWQKIANKDSPVTKVNTPSREELRAFFGTGGVKVKVINGGTTRNSSTKTDN